jgi:Family of unknown function (DUF6178)
VSLVPSSPAGLPARQRIAALLDAPDPEAAVQALPATDFYAMCKEVGLGDAGDLIALAAPEQIQACLDLDVWSGEQLRDLDVRPWLFALVETGPEKLTQVWRELDQELPALLLQRWCRIYQLAEEEVPDWEEPPFVPTPDRYYMLKVTAEDGDTVRLVELLVDRLYREDAVLARHSIRAAATEPVTELEEQLHRWRSGRLQDLGFAPLEEALEIYRPIDITKVAIPEGTGDADRPPAEARLLPVLAQPLAQAPFLSRAVAKVADQQRLEGALALLLNKVLAARRVEPSDTVAAAVAATYGAATLSLGLETLARGDVDLGAHALSSMPLNRIHRVGWSLVLSLARLARSLGPAAARLDDPLVAALLAPRPTLEDGRPVASVADVRRVTSTLAVLRAKIDVAVDVLGLGEGPIDLLLRTVILRAVIGLPLLPPTVTPDDVRRYRDAPGRDIQGDFTALGKPLPEEFAAVVSGYRQELETELAQLDPTDTPDATVLSEVLHFAKD